MSQNLSTKQNKAIEALLDGATREEAAAAAGINRKTLQRWQDEPVFSSTLQAQSRTAVGDASRRLTLAMDAAVTTIIEVMDGRGGEGAALRLRAAKIALDSAIRLNELTDIMQRLEALEKRI